MAIYDIAGLKVEMEPQTAFARKLLEGCRTESDRVDMRVTPCEGEPEHTSLLRRISMELLYRFDGMYLHGGALLYKGKVWLFVAPSGTGKSTHLALWKRLLGEQAVILNGDKPLLRLIDGRFYVYGTPWKGKEGWGVDGNGPLAGIYILKRAEENRVEPMAELEILNMLLSQTARPEDREGMHKLLDLIGGLMEQVPINALYCNTHISAAQTVLRHMER